MTVKQSRLNSTRQTEDVTTELEFTCVKFAAIIVDICRASVDAFSSIRAV
mgnify:CR=1 FL=1